MSTMRRTELHQQQRRSTRRLMAGMTAVVLTLAGSPAAAAAPPTPDEVAQATLDHIVDGDFVAAVGPFDPALQKRFPANALGEAWGAYQQLLGQYQSHGDPEDVPRAPLTVVNIPVQMAQQP